MPSTAPKTAPKNEGDTKNVYSQNKSVQLSNLLKLIKTNNKEY